MTFCHADAGCNTVVEGLKFPNGLVRSEDGLIYVPSSMTGIIDVYRAPADNKLEKIDEIKTDYALDNISIDENGDLYVAAFPVGIGVLKAYNDPYGSHPAAAALRITKAKTGYNIEKIIEDDSGEMLPAATTVVHDAKTGRLFLSSMYLSP